MEICFPKLYRYDRGREHCQIAVPFAEGALSDCEQVRIIQGGRTVPAQFKVTSRHRDGSVRYLFARFLADLPGNRGTALELRTDGKDDGDAFPNFTPVSVNRTDSGFEVRGGHGGVTFAVSDGASSLFDRLDDGRRKYTAEQFAGPFLETGDGQRLRIRLGRWTVEENGPLTAVLRCMGRFDNPLPDDTSQENNTPRETDAPPGKQAESVTFEVKLTAWAEKPWVEISFRIIDSTANPLPIASLVFAVLADGNAAYDPSLPGAEQGQRQNGAQKPTQSTDTARQQAQGADTARQQTQAAEQGREQNGVRTCAASSNYRTDFIIEKDGAPVCKIVDAAWLAGEANEHLSEVFYGTFFADRTDAGGGVCATIFQAQQNYPKAVKADKSGVYVMLVPKGTDRVVMESGMSREQRFLLHFHGSDETLAELDNRSLIYQMPDRPYLPPRVFQEAGVMPDIFVPEDRTDCGVEAAFYTLADSHARCYGMLNWGDAPDPGYTTQGRGKGKNVWTNNEYDYPHACALLYARTGERRFLDYTLTAAGHWMDVDICHYSQDPLLLGGQWEHSRRHCLDSRIVCSHQWVEGLLDYYHFTGDERAMETARGIGENLLRLLETPTYQTSGESTARETGWALRSLCALYAETWEEKWAARCDWIVNQFLEWFGTYGAWISPYTDNTMIRVPFMIAVAVGSLMRYWRLFPRDDVKTMILAAVDDLIETCYMKHTGVFFYKELPSLGRLGNNTLMLEALTIAYELSGDKKYLAYGRRTFQNAIQKAENTIGGVKTIMEDAVIQKGDGTKTFAQSFLPLAVYYKAVTENQML